MYEWVSEIEANKVIMKKKIKNNGIAIILQQKFLYLMPGQQLGEKTFHNLPTFCLTEPKPSLMLDLPENNQNNIIPSLHC